MPKKKSSLTPAALLVLHVPPVRALAERLRQLVRATVPEATESVNAGWHSLSYKHPVCGYFCGVFPQAEDVLLAFEFGVLLNDPRNLLEGVGSQVRFVRVKRNKDIRPLAFKEFIHAALDLPPQRDIKLAMIKSGAKPRVTMPTLTATRLKRPVYAMPAFVEQALLQRDLMEAYHERPAYQQNDYLGWIARAKRPETQLKRLSQMLTELRNGDKYMNMVYRPKTPLSANL